MSATAQNKPDPKPRRGRKPARGTARPSPSTACEASAPPLKPTEAPPSDLPTRKADGVMVLLSPHIDARQVRWREHKVGRLLEVRFGFGASPFVLLAVYQHVWSSNKTTQQNRRDEASLLSASSKAVKQVPSRTSLVVAGDFNASLQPSARLVGPMVCHAAPRPDSDGLQALVEELKLVALNTRHTSKPHTFVQGSSLSQIDFVFTKEIESGSRAKLATPLHLGSWKVGGHLPIAATIQPIGHWMLPAPKKPAPYDLQQLQHAVREGSDEAEAMRAWVAERMPTTHPDESNAVLLEAAALFLPKAQDRTQRIGPLPLGTCGGLQRSLSTVLRLIHRKQL